MNINKLISISLITVFSVFFIPAALAEEGNLNDSSGRSVRDGFRGCVLADSNTFDPDCRPEVPQPVVEKPQPIVLPPPVVYTAPPPPPKRAPVIQVLNLNASGGSNFANHSAKLTALARARLSDFATHIRTSDVTPVSIGIVGHTDSNGTVAHNQKLSIKRAVSIANFLVDQGLNKELIRISGKGESQPVASNKTPMGRAANRRVEITINGRKLIER